MLDAVVRLVRAQSELRRGLGGALAAAVGEDDAVRDDRRLGTVHIPGDPSRGELQAAIALFHFESGDRAGGDLAVLPRRFEGGVFGPPEGSQHPAGATRVHPARHGTPDARGGARGPPRVRVSRPPSERTAGPVRPHIPPPAGPQLPTLVVARS